MNYNHLEFWILFACVMLPYWWLSHQAQNRLLLVVSYVFYGFWDHRFLFLILISTAIDFVGGLGVTGSTLSKGKRAVLGATVVGAAAVLTSGISVHDVWGTLPDELADLRVTFATIAIVAAYGLGHRSLYALSPHRRRQVFLVISMVANLAILGFFKYCDFFIESFNDLLMVFGVDGTEIPLLNIILPAGISFYTFQAMSYTIDIYRGQLTPTDRFGDFALFVCFFPHLVAGPIMRAHVLLPQVLNPRVRKPGAFEEGLLLVLLGLFKKVAVADNVAPIANAVFSRLATGDTSGLTGAHVLVGIYAFAVQIYCDFSGYSSIARGISKWLGFELTINFRQPYLAVSPSDFWKRWHISLSSWLRDYLYIPLGGNRHGVASEYRNLLITMLLGGLWHGASWTFVGWGLYHGVILCIFRIARVRDVNPNDGRLVWATRVFVMFHLTCLGWLFFRADSFETVWRALALVGGDFQLTSSVCAPLALIVFYSGVMFGIEVFARGEDNLQRVMRLPVLTQSIVYTYLLMMIFVFHASVSHEFIYFQF